MKARMLCLVVGFGILLLAGCSREWVPTSFSVVEAGGWSTIEIREGVDCEHAWNMLLDILIKEFDVEYALREDGYLRSSWLYTWQGVYDETYRVRMTFRLAKDCTRLYVKPEAQFMRDGVWTLGTDNRLISTFKSDLMGTLGRTSR